MIHATRFFLVISLISSLTGCGLPQIQSAPAFKCNEIEHDCREIFPDIPTQYVHSMTFILPGGGVHVAIGITSISPETGTIHCAVMTIEGMVVFEAEYRQTMTIHRSIPPFDSMEFARTIMDDIRLVFFQPAGSLIEAGSLAPGSSICRYKTPDGMTVDVITHENDGWEIRQYTPFQRRVRTIKALFADKNNHQGPKKAFAVPSMIEVTAHGIFGYSLTLELLDVRQIPS